MAGSYNHIVTKKGNLRSNESFVDMIENLGDAYEMTEELFGMIWYLVTKNVGTFDEEGNIRLQTFRANQMKEQIEEARRNYKKGLAISQVAHRLSPDNRRKDD